MTVEYQSDPKTLPDEVWVDVPGYEKYEVSSFGRIRTKPKILKPHSLPHTAHMLVSLGAKRRDYVHRIVMESFVGRDPNRPWVNHKDGDPTNNRLDNLEWCTPGENIADGWRRGSHENRKTLRPVIATTQCGEILDFPTVSAGARAFGVTSSAVSSAIRRNGMCGKAQWQYA